MRRDEKTQYVEELRAQLAAAEFIVRTRYQGLDVTQMTELRFKVREAGGRYRVVKNTLLRLAVADGPFQTLVEDLKGPVALAFTTGDPVATAKAVADFSKAQDLFAFEGGVLGELVLTPERVKALAELPSLDALRAQFLSLLQTVPRNLMGVLQASARDLVGVLEARRQSLEEAA